MDKINTSTQEPLEKLISSDKFDKLSDENQKEVIKSIGNSKEEEHAGGFMGKIFGIKKENAALHIAFWICCILLLFCLLDIIRAFVIGKTAYTDLVKNVLPIISLALGYMLGQNDNKSK